MSEGGIKWKPKGQRLILKRIEEVNGSIIIMPTKHKDSSMICEVVELGTLTDDQDYKIGDKLLIGRYSGFDVPVLDRQYADCIIVNEDDILCFDNANIQGE